MKVYNTAKAIPHYKRSRRLPPRPRYPGKKASPTKLLAWAQDMEEYARVLADSIMEERAREPKKKRAASPVNPNIDAGWPRSHYEQYLRDEERYERERNKDPWNTRPSSRLYLRQFHYPLLETQKPTPS